MDKNTLLGFLLMGMVIFGFMYINKGQQERRIQEMEQQAEAQQAEAAKNEKKSFAVDTLTAAEAAAVPSVVRMAAAGDTASAPRYKTSKVDLVCENGAVSGTVQALDTVLDYAAVASGRFGDDISLDNRREALKNLRGALEDADRYRGFARHLSGTDRTVSLRNDVVDLELQALGGRIARATLLDYDTYLPKSAKDDAVDTARVQVMRPGDASYSFILTSATQRFNTADFYFTPEQVNDSTVMMKLDLGGGAFWGLRYTLPKGSYVVRMDIVQKGMESIIPPSVATADFHWSQRMHRNEVGRTFEERNSGLYYKFIGDSPDNLNAQGEEEEQLDQRLKWIAFKNQFFSSVMIPRSAFLSAEVSSKDLKGAPHFVKDLSAKATIDYNSTSENPASFDIFLGPNLYPLLDKLSDELKADKDDPSLDLTDLIPLGWPIFRWINTLIIIPVFTFLSKFISSYGLIIFLLTVFIKVILFPLTYKSLSLIHI